ncbi:hypothetical protein LDO51_14360 [Providencia alcalifaciens]|uniref:hypothetical protein n=1 Tax=Providencia alcalifaciens TaxID=126385 RepID=UPI001CE061D9|nr:hypothetical protein [Providencia alcalifaciens]UBX48328.1 hypothetical protein LDO51_14360 [Providencia alcalifaciens]
MKKGIITTLLALLTFVLLIPSSSARLVYTADEMNAIINKQGVPYHEDWHAIYADHINFELCSATVDLVYLISALENPTTLNLSLSRSKSRIAWLPEYAVRTDCNGYGNNVLIMTADYASISPEQQ